MELKAEKKTSATEDNEITHVDQQGELPKQEQSETTSEDDISAPEAAEVVAEGRLETAEEPAPEAETLTEAGEVEQPVGEAHPEQKADKVSEEKQEKPPEPEPLPVETDTPQAEIEAPEAPTTEQGVEASHDNDAAEESTHDEEEDDHHDDEEVDLTLMGPAELVAFVQSSIENAGNSATNRQVQRARNLFFSTVEQFEQAALNRFLENGGEATDFQAPAHPQKAAFQEAFKNFRKARASFQESMTRERAENLQKKKEIIEKLRLLNDDSMTSTSYQEVRRLQEEWKSIRPVPSEERESLNQTYHIHLDNFYKQRELFKEFLELDRKKNLAVKEEVVQQLKALADIENLKEAMRHLRQLQEEWRTTGPVPREKEEEINSAYKETVVAFLNKRDDALKEQHEKREQNYEAKLAIVEKLKELALGEYKSSKEWLAKNDEVVAWLNHWKEIGPVPYDKADSLRDILQAATQEFNRRKNDYFKERKKEKNENLKAKTQLCEQVESYAEAENPASHRGEVRKIQEQWRKIGPVPPKVSDKIWKRFTAACDAFYKKVSANMHEKEHSEQENLKAKLDILSRAEALVTAAPPDLESQVRGLQAEWQAVGFVPFQEKDKVGKRYKNVMDQLFGLIRKHGRGRGRGGTSAGPVLDYSDPEAYQKALEAWLTEKDARNKFEQEERRLQRDLRQIEDELATLENNMSFFRNAKNASAFTAPTEQKIEHLNQQAEDIKDLVRMVRTIGKDVS